MGAKTSIRYNAILSSRLPALERIYGGPTSALTVATDRYAELCAREGGYLRGLFSAGERDLMLNNALSTAYEPAGIIPGAVLADTEDEDTALFEEFGVGRAALLAKLRGLNLGQQIALVAWLEEMRAEVAPTPEEAEE